MGTRLWEDVVNTTFFNWHGTYNKLLWYALQSCTNTVGLSAQRSKCAGGVVLGVRLDLF